MSEFSDIPRDVSAADLPAGETVLWRGKPDWRHLALDAFHAPLICLYFMVIGTWHLATALHDGASRIAALEDASVVLMPCALALAVVSVLAWLSARATVFTLTDRRLVMRYGVALPALINIPLAHIETMRVRKGFGGVGDLAFSLPRKGRLSFHQLWPYARPWRLFPADPMMRAVPEAAALGELFAKALSAAADQDAGAMLPAAMPLPASVPGSAEPLPRPAAA